MLVSACPSVSDQSHLHLAGSCPIDISLVLFSYLTYFFKRFIGGRNLIILTVTPFLCL